MLTEILFTPVADAPPFIEVSNAGTTAVDVDGAMLSMNGSLLSLSGLAQPLAPGDRLVVIFDVCSNPFSSCGGDSGMPRIDGTVIHVADFWALAAVGGSAELVDRDGVLLDRVAWGSGQASAVSLVVGDFAAATIEPGSTIGRPPGANDPLQPTDWVLYPPTSASPGAPNAVPPVAVLLPIDGAILDGPQPTLEWYPVTGATSYHVQVAADKSFSAPLVDTTVTEPQIGLGSLPPGSYVWHVQAIAADGSSSEQSALSGFQLGAAAAQVEPAVYRGGPASAGAAAISDVGKQLAVPWLVQHKDTAMLLLEEPHEHAPMAWDTAHQPASRYDKADQFNCAIAMVAMVNHFYGGDLSQDRIGYEQFKNRQPGPEEDLNYGYGLTVDQTNAAFAFALGAPVTFVPEYPTYDAAWAEITASIDAGRPVAGANTHHGFVITGYAVKNGHRIISVNDPAVGQYTQDLDGSTVPPSDLSLWLMPDHPTARMQEKSVTTDSDGDGVVDFDETERFHTDPNNADTDGDKVHDKQDIASGVFDPTYGYAYDPQAESPGRDFDGDGMPTELDPDSDAGGCKDGEEDTNFDGHKGGSETSNFDTSDDRCQQWGAYGSLVYTERHDLESSLESSHSSETLSINVRLKNDPNSLGLLTYIDDGSTFSYRLSSTLETPPDSAGCALKALITEAGGGSIAQVKGIIGGQLLPPEEDFSVSADIPVQGPHTTDGCLIVQNGRPEDNATMPSDCEAHVARKEKPNRTYVFACGETLADGSWSVTGTITVP